MIRRAVALRLRNPAKGSGDHQKAYFGNRGAGRRWLFACERRQNILLQPGRIRQDDSGFIWRDVARDGNYLMLRLL
jgi:hypothetical protein